MANISRTQAMEYVARIEREWAAQWEGDNAPDGVILDAAPCADCDGFTVHTSYGEWGVWMQSNGQPYGEC